MLQGRQRLPLGLAGYGLPDDRGLRICPPAAARSVDHRQFIGVAEVAVAACGEPLLRMLAGSWVNDIDLPFAHMGARPCCKSPEMATVPCGPAAGTLRISCVPDPRETQGLDSRHLVEQRVGSARGACDGADLHQYASSPDFFVSSTTRRPASVVRWDTVYPAAVGFLTAASGALPSAPRPAW